MELGKCVLIYDNSSCAVIMSYYLVRIFILQKIMPSVKFVCDISNAVCTQQTRACPQIRAERTHKILRPHHTKWSISRAVLLDAFSILSTSCGTASRYQGLIAKSAGEQGGVQPEQQLATPPHAHQHELHVVVRFPRHDVNAERR